MIHVVIVDDHPIVIDGIKKLINSQTDIQITGTALCGKDCENLLQQVKADVLLLDINLPDIDGVELCKQIIGKYPLIKIVAFTSFIEYYHIQKMLSNGAFGYILKNALSNEIIEGIRTVFVGKQYLCSEAMSIISSRKKSCNEKLFLTKRETELLKLIANGDTNKEIAKKLFLGVETVNSYRKNLLLKLGAKNSAEMVKIALTEKIV